MINIAIVEDEAMYAKQLQEFLQQYQKENGEVFNITVYSDGDQIVHKYKSQFDIILMDVEMKFMDGMSAAEEIRKADTEVVIIFITNMAQYAIRGYAVDALDYVLKPVSYFAFSQRLNRAISRMKKREQKVITVNIKGGAVRINIANIYYIESQGHNLVLHTILGDYESAGTMKEVEEKLQGLNFCRGNKGYLINLQHVDGIQDGCLFSIDTDQLESAFQFDPGKLDLDLSGAFDLSDGSVDFSSLIDPDSFQFDLTETPDIDMSALTDVFANMDISIPADKMQQLAQKVMTGYKDYIIGNGILGLDKIGFDQYLASDQFQQLMKDSMGSLIDTAALQEQFTAAMQQVMGSVMANFSEQIAAELQAQLGTAMEQAMGQISTNLQSQMTERFSSLGSQMESALKIDADAFRNAIRFNMTEDDLAELMKSKMMSTSATYESNLQAFGYASEDDPSQISIYPLDFEQKAEVLNVLDSYNAAMREQGAEDKVIQYTDVVGTLMTSVTRIINMISNMLVAFVSISLVVSSIMIGIITYISVLERRKEIGILRAIGASKRNISEVFNAETFIIGLCSGLMGIGLSRLLLIPGNMLIQKIAVGTSVVAVLPWKAAVVLVALATVLTILGGFIPAKTASRSDPVKALRAE